MTCWSDDEETKIIVTGNAGIGKSWFQVYFLQQLIIYKSSSGKKELLPSIRFILRQSNHSFFLLDLETCDAWQIFTATGRIRKLPERGKKLYELLPGFILSL